LRRKRFADWQAPFAYRESRDVVDLAVDVNPAPRQPPKLARRVLGDGSMIRLRRIRPAVAPD